MVEKVTTIMALKVDLQCHRCYKKVKKILCKIPQIRDQVYDEKQNTVVIKVVCCSPEKIKEKIRCKGGDSIKSIEIVPPPPPPKPKPPPAEKPKPVDKPPEPAPKPMDKIPNKPKTQNPTDDKSSEELPPTKGDQSKKEEAPPPKDVPVFVPFCPPVYQPNAACCTECSEGRPGGACFHGQGQPRPCYVDYGRPVYDSYGTGGWYRGNCHVSRCDNFCEEYPSGCTVM